MKGMLMQQQMMMNKW